MDSLSNKPTPLFHLSGASLLRPVFSRPSHLPGFLIVSAASTVAPVRESYDCPYIDSKLLWQNGLHYDGLIERIQQLRPDGSTISSLFQRIQSWWHSWMYIESPAPSRSTNITNLRWEGSPATPSATSPATSTGCEKSCFDYVKLVQLIISVIGIGLSLRLMFYLVEQINPTAKEKRVARKRAHELFSQMGLKSIPPLTDYEVGIAVNLVDSRVLSTEWESIGGLDGVIDDLQQSVIAPFHQLQLIPNFHSKLLRPPKGVLLFGPPGCGKTMLARAMARAAKASFINLQISTLVNMWYGETQKYVEATFTLVHKLQPCILFIDEVDSFLTTRSCTDNESTRMIKTQFMALWDGLLTEENTRILIIGATNRPEDLDQAILRRLPYKVAVPMPDLEQRFQILSIYLRDEPMASALSGDNIREIAARTENLSGSDLTELCREAAFCCYRAQASNPDPQNMLLRPEHFTMALQKFLRNRVNT